MVAHVTAGKQTLRFSSITEFFQWKEHEESGAYTTYVKGEQTYYPTSKQHGRQLCTHTSQQICSIDLCKCYISYQLGCVFTTTCNVQTSSVAIIMCAAEMETIVEITNRGSPNKQDATRTLAANST